MGRILNSEHPLLKILKAKLQLDSYFEPKLQIEAIVDPMLNQGLKLLRDDRNKMWADTKLDWDRRLLAAIRNMGIKEAVVTRGHNSIPFFNCRCGTMAGRRNSSSNDSNEGARATSGSNDRDGESENDTD